MTLPIYDITPFTMLDFPERTACIIWLAGCNMRCQYCHNPDIVRGGKGKKTVSEVLEFLKTRQGLLDGVVLSGGEATLYPALLDLARQIKAMGFEIKLDTNGTRPVMLRELMEEGLLDYVAMDLKATPANCRAVTGRSGMEDTLRSLQLLCAQDSVRFEIRTTLHSALHSADDLDWMVEALNAAGYRGTYYLQPFRDYEGRTMGALPPDSYRPDLAALPAHPGFDIAMRAS